MCRWVVGGLSKQKPFGNNTAGLLLIVVCCLSLYVALPTSMALNDGLLQQAYNGPDFSLSASNLGESESGVYSFAIKVSCCNYGVNTVVTLIYGVNLYLSSDLPRDTTAKLTPNSGDPPYDATLTITPLASWVSICKYATCEYWITVKGTGFGSGGPDGVTHTITVHISVLGSPP